MDEQIFEEEGNESGHKDSERALHCFGESRDIILVENLQGSVGEIHPINLSELTREEGCAARVISCRTRKRKRTRRAWTRRRKVIDCVRVLWDRVTSSARKSGGHRSRMGWNSVAVFDFILLGHQVSRKRKDQAPKTRFPTVFSTGESHSQEVGANSHRQGSWLIRASGDSLATVGGSRSWRA